MESSGGSIIVTDTDSGNGDDGVDQLTDIETIDFGGATLDISAATTTATGGDDLLILTSGSDNVDAGAGADTVYGGSGGDTIFGGVGDDEIFGDIGDDDIDGGLGDDTLLGGAGNDTLDSGGGGDVIDGGAGADLILIDDGAIDYGLAAIDGGTGTDTVRLEAAAPQAVDKAGLFDSGVLTDIELIDFTGANVDATMSLTQAEIEGVTDGDNDLIININAGDSVDAIGAGPGVISGNTTIYDFGNGTTLEVVTIT
ncbi:MAG: hypothetical protein AAFX08_05000 [Pseudomonadota bacterium]